MKKNETGKTLEVSSEGAVCVKKKCGRLWGKLLVLVILVILVVAGCYYFKDKSGTLSVAGGKNQASSQADQSQAQQQILAIVAKVKRLMVLPDNELPQVVVISDAAQAAKAQPFLAGAQNGDVLLVYVSQHKAIVYSPARDIIVNVGPVYMDNSASSTTSSVQTQTPSSTKKK